jgi:hypothetical protein
MTLFINKYTQLVVLIGVFIVLFFPLESANLGYSQAIKTFDVKAKIDDVTIERGDPQTFRVTVKDHASELPVAGAYVQVSALYPGGSQVKSEMELTDTSGQVTMTLPTGEGTELGTLSADVKVTLVGFKDKETSIDYAVVSEDLNDYTMTSNIFPSSIPFHIVT